MPDEVVPTLVDAVWRKEHQYETWSNLSKQYLQTINPVTRMRRTNAIGAVTVRKKVLGCVTCGQLAGLSHISLVTLGVKLSRGLIVLRAAIELGITWTLSTSMKPSRSLKAKPGR